eukprot:COSAG01_NODE_10777_length_2080_cov_29.263370_2_plen_154_part_00
MKVGGQTSGGQQTPQNACSRQSAMLAPPPPGSSGALVASSTTVSMALAVATAHSKTRQWAPDGCLIESPCAVVGAHGASFKAASCLAHLAAAARSKTSGSPGTAPRVSAPSRQRTCTAETFKRSELIITRTEAATEILLRFHSISSWVLSVIV